MIASVNVGRINASEESLKLRHFVA